MIERFVFGTANFYTTDKKQYLNYCKILEKAYEIGIRFFDTAPSYGSEAILGDVFHGVNDVQITSKIGKPSNKLNKKTTLFHLFYQLHVKQYLSRTPKLKKKLKSFLSRRKNYSITDTEFKHQINKQNLENSIERSLMTLRRDRIRSFLIHEPDRIILSEDAKEYFMSLTDHGFCNYTGCGTGGIFNSKHKIFGTILQGAGWDESINPDNLEHEIIIHGLISSIGMDGLLQFIKQYPMCKVAFSCSFMWQIDGIEKFVLKNV